jgi:hypothetical protein
VGESLSTKIETIKVCHALLQNPKFLSLLLQIDTELAAQMHSLGCPCGGTLHRADYPRKPRACPKEIRNAFDSRLSFCCSLCRKRSTSASVRFLGRRVYLGLVVMLVPVRRAKLSATAAQVVQTLGVPQRTVSRWRSWWLQIFPATPLWLADCARFMPPVQTEHLPHSLIERFKGDAANCVLHLLAFLSPLSVHR